MFFLKYSADGFIMYDLCKSYLFHKSCKIFISIQIKLGYSNIEINCKKKKHKKGSRKICIYF